MKILVLLRISNSIILTYFQLNHFSNTSIWGIVLIAYSDDDRHQFHRHRLIDVSWWFPLKLRARLDLLKKSGEREKKKGQKHLKRKWVLELKEILRTDLPGQNKMMPTDIDTPLSKNLFICHLPSVIIP